MSDTQLTPTAMNYVGLLHLTALPAWLTLDRAERGEVVKRHVEPLLKRFPTVRVRWFDVEAFTATSSDVLFAEFNDPQTWNALIEELRDTPVFALPYFRLDQILVGLEDGFRHHEDFLAAGPRP